ADSGGLHSFPTRRSSDLSEEGVLADDIHGFDRTVTSLTLHATNIHVLGMVKVRQIRKVVNPHPLYRGVGFVSLNNLGDFRFAGKRALLDLVVAVHADIGRGDIGVLARHHARMAVVTIDLKLPFVYIVLESNWLCRRVSLLYAYGIQAVDHCFKAQSRHDEDHDKDKAAASHY